MSFILRLVEAWRARFVRSLPEYDTPGPAYDELVRLPSGFPAIRDGVADEAMCAASRRCVCGRGRIMHAAAGLYRAPGGEPSASL
jgi:hypothetical protein